MLHFAPHDPKRLAWDAYQRARGDLPRDDRGDEPPPQLYASPAILALWYAIKPLSDAQARLARALYDELTNLAMGRGLSLGAMAKDEDGRLVVEVSGALDLTALARRANPRSDLTTLELRDVIVVTMAEYFDQLIGDVPGPSAPDVALSLAQELLAEGRRRLLCRYGAPPPC
jgi:hypothetical protein